MKKQTETDPENMLRVQLLDLKENMCRWPIGDPQKKGFFFCGLKKAGTGPYCEHHARIAFQYVPRRKTASCQKQQTTTHTKPAQHAEETPPPAKRAAETATPEKKKPASRAKTKAKAKTKPSAKSKPKKAA